MDAFLRQLIAETVYSDLRALDAEWREPNEQLVISGSYFAVNPE